MSANFLRAPACAAATWALAAVSTASALWTRARSSSSSCRDAAPSWLRVCERISRLLAAPSSAPRWATSARTATTSLSRSAIWDQAAATASSRCACRVSTCNLGQYLAGRY